MTLREILWQQILLQIYKQRGKQQYISKIHRKLSGSLTHMRAVLRRMEDSGLIRIIPNKNMRMLQLTKRGEKVALALLSMKSELNSLDDIHDRL